MPAPLAGQEPANTSKSTFTPVAALYFTTIESKPLQGALNEYHTSLLNGLVIIPLVGVAEINVPATAAGLVAGVRVIASIQLSLAGGGTEVELPIEIVKSSIPMPADAEVVASTQRMVTVAPFRIFRPDMVTALMIVRFAVTFPSTPPDEPVTGVVKLRAGTGIQPVVVFKATSPDW